MKHTLLLLACTMLFFTTPAQIITTVAGNGTSGNSGDYGAATDAQILRTTGLAADRFGNLYLGDNGYTTIRRVDQYGVIYPFAGSGVCDSFNGDGIPATDANICIIDLAVDTYGNVYIEDGDHYRIRKVDALTGIISTVAGNGINGFWGDNGPATNAQIAGVNGIWVDRQGNIYISDYGNNRLRKIDSLGIIKTIAGNGMSGYNGDHILATNAALDLNGVPTKIFVDKLGEIIIPDVGNLRIRKVDTSGIITTIAGTGAFGYNGDGIAATNAQITAVNGLVVNKSNEVLFTDQENNRVRKIDTNGVISTIAGTGMPGFSGDGSSATLALIHWPTALCIDTSNAVYFTDLENYRIRAVKTSGLLVEDQSLFNVDVIPNPNKGSFVFEVNSPVVQNIHVIIYNMLGFMVFETEGKTNQRIKINSNLPKGVYYLKVLNQSFNSYSKFIID